MKKIVLIALAAALSLCFILPASALSLPEYEVTASADNIVIDGRVDDGEWGDPVFTVTPQECVDKIPDGWNYWRFIPMPENQHFELYVTNDGDNVYVAGKLVGAQEDMTCVDSGNLWEHPHFTFTFAPYDKDYVCPVTKYEGQYYEVYACYSIGFVNGEPVSKCTTQGMDATALDEDMYGASYDAATQTYHYECKFPYRYSNLELANTNVAVMGLDITDAALEGTSGNRYLVSAAGERAMAWMGPGVFSHNRTNPLKIILHDAESMRTEHFEPLDEDALAIRHAEERYAENSPKMTAVMIFAIVAAVCSLAAATVCVIKYVKDRKKQREEGAHMQ